MTPACGAAPALAAMHNAGKAAGALGSQAHAPRRRARGSHLACTAHAADCAAREAACAMREPACAVHERPCRARQVDRACLAVIAFAAGAELQWAELRRIRGQVRGRAPQLAASS